MIARSLPIPLSDAAIESGLNHLDGNPPMEMIHAPIHPFVAQHFKLSWCDETTRFHLNSVEGTVTHREYIRRYLQYNPDEDAYHGHWQTTRATSPAEVASAEKMLTRALARSPRNASWSLILGLNIMRQGEARGPDALRYLEMAAVDPDVGGDARTHASIGLLRGRLGDHDGAILAYRRAIQIRDFGPHRMRVARHLTALGRLDEAIAEMKVALGMNSCNTQWHAALGRALLRVGDKEQAAYHLRRAAENGLSASPHHADPEGGPMCEGKAKIAIGVRLPEPCRS